MKLILADITSVNNYLLKSFKYFRIAESPDSQSEDRISKSLQQQLDISECFRTINHFLLNTIGNNKGENSLKGSCHLRPSLNTTQTCESMFTLRTTIDHTGCMCNTLHPKLLIKHTNSDNLKLLLMSCFKFLLIGGLNTDSRGIHTPQSYLQ